jgi:hypothetical protein
MKKNLIGKEKKYDFGFTSKIDVNERLRKSNSKSSPGSSVDIEALVFKECAGELAPTLTDLFNVCLTQNKMTFKYQFFFTVRLISLKSQKLLPVLGVIFKK